MQTVSGCTAFWGFSAGLHSTRRQKRMAANAVACWNTEILSWMPLVSVLRPSTNSQQCRSLLQAAPSWSVWHCRQQELSLCIHLYFEMTSLNSSFFLAFICSNPLLNIHPTSSITTQAFSHLFHIFVESPPPHFDFLFFFFLKCPILNDSKTTTIKTPKALHVM